MFDITSVLYREMLPTNEEYSNADALQINIQYANRLRCQGKLLDLSIVVS